MGPVDFALAVELSRYFLLVAAGPRRLGSALERELA